MGSGLGAAVGEAGLKEFRLPQGSLCRGSPGLLWERRSLIPNPSWAFQALGGGVGAQGRCCCSVPDDVQAPPLHGPRVHQVFQRQDHRCEYLLRGVLAGCACVPC